MQRWPHIVLSAVFGSLAVTSAQAASDYPTQAIRVIVPFAPGGSTDIVARIVVQEMSKIIGKSMVIENKAGAGGAIGAADAARAKPDGYTLSIATVSTMAVNPACRPDDLTYDPIKDFAPVSNFVNTPNVVEVHPSFPASNFKEFVAELKKNPKEYSYASPGVCSIAHLMGEAFKQQLGVQVSHVPYKGAGPALTDVVGGQVKVMFDNLPSSMPNILSGKLKPIVLAWPERIKELPDLPTYAEVGHPDLNNGVFYGLLAPAGTPKDVIAKLNETATAALKAPNVVAALQKQGAIPDPGSPEHFAEEIKRQYDIAKEIVKKGNLQMKRN
ncbi:ABC transporter substrate-binding protein [Advenella kashmirensis W13003]|uniref:ABC transporter substrate-binding protein n=1 Tax=Advenella kashmirensis W13003 TaxID=1424334 RepID=V8QQP8_9BURK|nr:tripartite tricarboxylate transporter substrate binding protein BugE [Advenella kashmirensis]ETF01967.1 ABC transporter substrate-binding protein [Advenella kashmirensis W13003]